MNIKDLLLEEHSKAQALKITDYVGDSQERFDELMVSFFDDEWFLNQRAAYPLTFIAEKYPQLFEKHLEPAIYQLRQPKHNAVKRNTLRILTTYKIPEHLRGTVVDICFDFLASHQEPVAVKMFSMVILFEEGKKEPDLLQELKILIEDQMERSTAGFTSRGRKILKYIYALETP